MLTINFSEMTPHIGQMLTLYVRGSLTGEYLDTVVVEEIMDAAFEISSNVIEPGNSYLVDFWADHNSNGMYDSPPTDHAWRLETGVIAGDTEIDFVHNTNFTDILPGTEYMLTINFTEMTPHIGQMLTLYVRDFSSGEYLDTVMVEEIMEANFEVSSGAVFPGNSYTVDFWADHNSNGMYDAPSTDHAWRLETGVIMGDTVIDFVHNTDFTDIFEGTGVRDIQILTFSLYPNPAGSMLQIRSGSEIESVSVLSLTGSRVFEAGGIGAREYVLSLEHLSAGTYLVRVNSVDGRTGVARLVKQ
ncbi:MAG: T9SS C-terminal target domain-containing protein [Bacteroidetes bacterium]|nr:MAG: T9SS C-terminal target domain-containing protein [Bacteroidota bacterium]